MTLIEGFVKDEVYIDFGADIHYGCDQVYLDYPCRFPTVSFMLMATNGLSRIADRIRKDAGYRPMHAMDEYTDETCDQNGWYDFYMQLDTFSNHHIGSCIEFIVVNSDSEDNEELYTIDLTEEEQVTLYNRLDEQCRTYLGKSCEELLSESKAEMEEEQ